MAAIPKLADVEALLGLNSKQDKVTETMRTIVEASRNHNIHASEIIKNESLALDNAQKIVQTETPEMESNFNTIVSPLQKFYSQEQDYIAGLRRSTEDLNDIIARFSVVFRAHDAAVETRNELNAARLKVKEIEFRIAQDKETGGKNIAKLKIEMIKAFAAKRLAIEHHRITIKHFIDAKERFNKFRTRRFKESFVHLGEALDNAKRTQLETLQEIDRACEQALEAAEAEYNSEKPKSEPEHAEEQQQPDQE